MNLNIGKIQTQHIGRIYSLQKQIKQLKNKKKSSEHLDKKLNKLVEDSTQQTQLNAKQFQNISLQNDLPIVAESQKIKDLLNTHQVLIVAGETGCGKTTQLPKICMQAGFGARGLIAHTQPRRVAATSVAKRIADEVNSPIGELVGYSIRFNHKTSDKTRVKIMTDGVLLTEIESDPLLSAYEVIIIDEAHERSLNIDFLLGFLKQILAKRKELKLIITSATIDPQRFSQHFANAPMVFIEGRTFPVEVRYRPIEIDDDNNSSDPLLENIYAAVEECIAESSGDILLFADGEGQIKSIVKALNDKRYNNTCVLPLYARLGMNEQQKIFSEMNKRKIIVSTNVAETSLTVPGIIFVIDIGNARISRFSQRNKIQQLPVEKISRASADQRKGRCGRIAPGICIRLYSEEDFNQREEFTCSEIQRTNLSSVALRLKSMQVKNVEHFPFMEPPTERAWNIAFNSLFELGAVDKDQVITSLGVQMAKLPVDPQLARILVQPNLIAVDEMLIICSLMSVREIRERPHDKQQKSDQVHSVYHKNDSDILTAINLWKQLEVQKKSLSSSAFKQWCKTNFINFLGWLEWRKVYFQLKESVENLGIKVNQSEAHDDEVFMGLIPGFITHVFYKTQEKYYQGVRDLKVWIHPSSLAFKNNKPWLLSAEMIETEKLYARMNAQIQPQWIEKLAPHLLKSHYFDIHWSKKNGQVMAYLNQSLLGLPIVNKRKVNYSNIDRLACRQLFLLEGLALDQIAEEFPFIKANRSTLQQLTEQEQRQRLNNICIDHQSLASLYEQKLPEHICSLISLKRWLKKNYTQNNQLITFTKNELTQNKINSNDEFPSSILVKGVNLNLSYCFAPGTNEDGVSVEIPAAMLSQFDDRDFDWLVPGYLQEKVLATIKSLPKLIRKDLFPLNDTALKCTEKLQKIDHNNKKFITEMASVLQKVSGKHIRENDFNMDSIEPHLTMKYKVNTNQSFSYLTSLAEAKSVKVQSAKKLQNNANHQYTSWDFNDFEIEKLQNNDNQSIRVFEGLVDFTNYVAIKQFPSELSATKSHAQGVARLILLESSSYLNQFFNSWPDKKILEKLSIRFQGFKSVFDCLALSCAIAIINNEKVTKTFTNKTYQSCKTLFQANFRQMLSEKLQNVLPLIKQREMIFSQISELNLLAFKSSIEDMRLQLNLLWSSEKILLAEANFINDYSRYQQGLISRIIRIKTNFPKEQAALDTWVEWLDWWDELLSSGYHLDLQPEIDELFWSLQEFKLSLFSPGIKLKHSISSKKLQKKFEIIESKL